MKNKILIILYWIWSCTWNCFATFLGLFITLYALIFRKGRIHQNGYGLLTEFGGNWGGLSMGPFQFSGRYNGTELQYYFEEVSNHEFGHSLQGLIWGPLYLLVIGIPSACRYFYANIKQKSYDWYHSMWFERQATEWGTNFMVKFEGGKR